MNSTTWVGVITAHARQRYIERIADPARYSHLRNCRRPSCSTCVSQAIEIRNTCTGGKKYIDWAIRQKIGLAQSEDSRVNNPSFLEVIQKTYPPDRNFDFWQYKGGVYVLLNPADQPSPTLLTVMSEDMIDGMVIQSATMTELTMYFDRWKRESQTNSYQREIENF